MCLVASEGVVFIEQVASGQVSLIIQFEIFVVFVGPLCIHICFSYCLVYCTVCGTPYSIQV